MNHKMPMLPLERLEGSQEEHVMTAADGRSGCKYCSYLALLHKAAGDSGRPPKVANVKRKCAKCNVYLCKDHFEAYHCPPVNHGGDDGEVTAV